MFSLQICRYSMGKLMTEVLKMVKKCKMYWNRGSQGNLAPWDLTKRFVRDLAVFKFCPGLPMGDGSAWNWLIHNWAIMPMMGVELATPRLQTECSSHWAIQLKSYCWEGVEFIQLVWCIIITLSFLNCHWFLIPEVQWFYWTQELLLPVEKFSVRMPKHFWVES